MIKRYTRPKMGALFTDRHKFDTWLKVELAVCEEWANQGGIPAEAFKRIKKKARFTLKRIEEVENTVHHDVIAFTTAVSDYIKDDSAYFHKGLTSSDVVDTSQSMVLKEAGQLIEIELSKLKQVIGKRALEHMHTPVIGRTHGVHAEPTTMGLKLLIWYDELSRHEERLAYAIDNLAVGKLSGAVGNFAHLPPSFEEKVLKSLGLMPAPVSNQVVQRDRHAQFICTLAILAATMEKIAVNLRTYQRTEIGEVQEPFAKGQKGSSAMPHKKNPILLERVTGLSRVLRGYAVTALENVALWDERDISHSGAERVILPDACITVDYMLAKLTSVIEGLIIRGERQKDNIYFTKGLVFSQRVLLKLTQSGVSREDAYAMVQRNALRCWEDGTPLLDALINDSDVREVLKPHEISELFSLEPYMAHVDEIFERVGLVPEGRRNHKGRDRRPRTRAKTQRDAEGHIDSVTLSTGAVQNISERASDYFESSRLTVEELEKLDKPDETIGEADHQKKLVKGTRSRTGRSRQTSRIKRETTAKEKEQETAKEKESDKENKDNNGDAQKPKRRRGSRGGRRHKKPGTAPADRKPSDDDDTYID